MHRLARLGLAAVAAAALAIPTGVLDAQAPAEPFKVGSFAVGGRQFVGLVLRDQFIVDITAANAATPSAIEAPATWSRPHRASHRGVQAASTNQQRSRPEQYRPTGDARAPMCIPGSVDILRADHNPWPSKITNDRGVLLHARLRGCTPEQLAARTKERQTNRGVPYLFLKPTRGAIIGDGDEVIMPFGRDEIEWEVELAIVFGRQARTSRHGARTTCSAT